MRGVDTSSCPNDFRAAYLSHIQAWEVLAEVEQKARKLKNESESARAFVEAFVRGLIMDPFGKANEMRAAENALEREAQAAKQQVMTTLNQVEQCALAYGASPSSR